MNEKEILKQLSGLKEIKPDSTWKEKNREILLSQVSSGELSLSSIKYSKGNNFSFFYSLVNIIHQPAFVVVSILLVVFGGGGLSVYASRDTKPGDSLYIAKMINEKAQLVITFDKEEKAKLGLTFAANRARELSMVLTGEDETSEKLSKVEKLTESIKKELAAVKTNLKESENNNPEVFSASSERDNNGISVYDPTKVEIESVMSDLEPIVEEKATSTRAISINEAIEEVGELLNNNDYSGTITKLEEINNSIGGARGEVKGIVESATTTEE